MGKKLDRKVEKARRELEKREARVSQADARLTKLETKQKVQERFQQLPTAKLNAVQCQALAAFFSFDPSKDDGEEWDWDENPTMELTLYPGNSSEAGSFIVLNGTFLRKDGEWSTFAPLEGAL